MLTCKQLTEQASEYVDGTLTFSQRSRIRLHLMLCRTCRDYVDQLALTIQALRQVPPEPAPEATRSAVLAALRAAAAKGGSDET